MEFQGIENVDQSELQRQYALTAALWSELTKQGVEDGTPGRIHCFFFAMNDTEVAALVPAFSDWDREISEVDVSQGKLSIRFVSSLVHMSEQALLELVDVAMIAAHQSSCIFDGFQVETSELQKERWWKFW